MEFKDTAETGVSRIMTFKETMEEENFSDIEDSFFLEMNGTVFQEEIIKVLDKIDPILLSPREDDADLSIHWKTLGEILADAATQDDGLLMFRNVLPILLRRKPPFAIIKFILDLVPTAARIPAHYRKLPLHIALAYGASVDVILLLLQVFPEAAVCQDDGGFTPADKATKKEQEGLFFEYLNNAGNVTWKAVQVLRGIIQGSQNARVVRLFLQPRKLANYEHNHLYAFFSVLSTESISEAHFLQVNPIPIDFNKKMLADWTVLELIVGRDDVLASRVFFFLKEALSMIDFDNVGTKPIVCKVFQLSNVSQSDYVLFRIQPKSQVSGETWRKVANLAKLSSFKDLQKWGESYGRLFGKYLIEYDERPKHVSDTCLVIFASELCGGRRETRVALKFMADLKAFERELAHRNEIFAIDANAHKHVVDIKAAYTDVPKREMCIELPGDRDIVHFGQNFDNPLFSQANIKLKSGERLRHMLVMECGMGQDLSDLVSHQNIAGRDLNLVCHLAMNIAEHLRYLNEEMGMMHGDVKARNFVVVGIGIGGEGLRVVDLDNASRIDGKSEVGEKRTSSGYLPPEQAAVESALRAAPFHQLRSEESNFLQANLIKWKEKLNTASDEDIILLIHGKIRETQDRLRSLETESSAIKVVATPQHDMWCFGVLLYLLCAAKQLFVMDQREEAEDTELRNIRNWSLDDLDVKCRSFKDRPGWRDLWLLLRRLLQPRKTDRPRKWSVVIEALKGVGVHDRLETLALTRRLTSRGEEEDVGYLEVSSDLLTEWNETLKDGPYVFISHRGPDTKYTIAWPLFWFLTRILKVSAFLDQPSMKPSTDKHLALSRAAHQCTHAVVLLSPGFRESQYCVRELNTLLLRRRRQERIVLVPALWLVSDVEGYCKELKDIVWLTMKSPGIADPALYLVEVLWPHVAETVPHGQGPFSPQDLVRFLLQYVEENKSHRPIPFLESKLFG